MGQANTQPLSSCSMACTAMVSAHSSSDKAATLAEPLLVQGKRLLIFHQAKDAPPGKEGRKFEVSAHSCDQHALGLKHFQGAGYI